MALRGKREIGNETAMMASVRQPFPFTARFNPQNPSDQRKQALAKAQQISTSSH